MNNIEKHIKEETIDDFPEDDIEGPATGEAPYKPDIAYTEGGPIMVGPLITELPPLVLSVDESPA